MSKPDTHLYDEKLNDPDVVVFAGTPTLQPGELEVHSFKDRLFGRRIEDVEGDWQQVSNQVSRLVKATSAEQPAGFRLGSIEISLGFTASGKLAFIAEAGVEASVTVTWNRPNV
jgi:hypothetical protein